MSDNLPGIWRLLFHYEDGLVDVSCLLFHFELLDPDDEDSNENWPRTTTLKEFIESFRKDGHSVQIPIINDISLPVDYAWTTWEDGYILIALPASSFIQAIEEGTECYRHYQNSILN